jgi:SNF2 family DNA or RNA helicase
MKFTPHAYQQRAVRWIFDHPHCGLFLDMGLGKSVITLTAVRHLIDECEISSALIVAPKKVAEATWGAEAAKWDHLQGLKVQTIIGTPSARLKALKTPADVYVTGRDNLPWLLEQCDPKRLPWDMLILDELTSFKSPSSLRFKALKRVRSMFARIVGLTGTPAPNGLKDLWAQMYCIDGGERLGKFNGRYMDQYFHAVIYNNIPIKYTLREGAEAKIRQAIADICLTMQAEEYLTLPPLIEIDDRVELDTKSAEAYETFVREQVMALAAEGADRKSIITATNAAGLLNKLSQMANGAIYTEGELPGMERRPWAGVHKAKIERLLEIVEAEQGGVLVFYQYKHDAERIEAALPRGVKVEQYDGPETLARWNAGKIDVLLAHPASTAYGLNMQAGGSCLVWFGTGWNLELYQQANARLHRQGQSRPVRCHRIIAAGTVDERAVAALRNKTQTQKALMDGLRALVDKYAR